jgi:hypothetical protein
MMRDEGKELTGSQSRIDGEGGGEVEGEWVLSDVTCDGRKSCCGDRNLFW